MMFTMGSSTHTPTRPIDSFRRSFAASTATAQAAAATTPLAAAAQQQTLNVLLDAATAIGRALSDDERHAPPSPRSPRSLVPAASRAVPSPLLLMHAELTELVTGPPTFSESYTQRPHEAASIVEHMVCPVPPDFASHNRVAGMKQLSGIFPEIQRAWHTNDSQIFFWHCLTAEDYIVYNQLDHCIESIAIARAKPHVFNEHIEYVLVVATTMDVVVLPIVLRDGKTLEIIWAGLSTPCKGVAMTKITSTSRGRVFLSGGDGNVWELNYQGRDTLWQSKISLTNRTQSLFSVFSAVNKMYARTALGSPWLSAPLRIWGTEPLVDIVIDEVRHTLATLGQSSTIQVYDMGDVNGTGGLVWIAKLEDPWATARGLCVDLREWGTREGSSLTDSEVEGLYDTLCRDLPMDQGLRIQRTKEQKIDILEQRGRLSRRFITSLAVIPTSESTLVSLVAITTRATRLYFQTSLDNPNLGPVHPTRLQMLHVRLAPGYLQASAQHAAFYANGMFLTACGVDTRDLIVSTAPDLSNDTRATHPFREKTNATPVDGRVLSFVEDTERDVVCVAQGAPSSPASPSKLGQTLALSHSKAPAGNGNLLTWNELALQHAVPQRRFLCLSTAGVRVLLKQRPLDALAAILQNSRGNDGDAEVARFFEVYSPVEGCAMCLALCCASENSVVSSSQLSAITHSLAREMSLEQTPVVNYSAMHDGFALHLSRVLRPLWAMPLVKLCGNRKGRQLLSLAWRSEQLAEVESMLRCTCAFVERNLGTRALRPTAPAGAIDTPRADDALQYEQRSFSGLVQLARVSAEVLALFQFLDATGLGAVAGRLPQSTFLTLQNVNLWQYVAESVGREVIAALIAARMEVLANDNQSIDADSAALGAKCPSLFSDNERRHFKGRELIKKAINAPSEDARVALLSESLEELRDVSRINVAEICQSYQAARYPEGVVELALSHARSLDPHGVAGPAAQTPEGRELYQAKKDCYEAVLALFTNYARNVPVVSIGQLGAVPSAEETKEKLFDLIRLSLRFADKCWHFELYAWMLSNAMHSDLLELNTQYVAEFLSLPEHADNLLWRWYEQHSDFQRAANCLLNTAENSLKCTLDDKIMLLSRAKAVLARIDERVDPSVVQLTQRIENRLDVAIVQLRVFNAIKTASEPAVEPVRDRLNSVLVDLQELYRICRDLRLNECLIAVMSCARFSDYNHICAVWNAVIDKELAENSAALASVQTKLLCLGKEYAGNSTIFPLKHLVNYLEKINQRVNTGGDVLSLQWVAETMQEAGVAMSALWSEYWSLALSSEDSWEFRSHVLRVLIWIARSWADRWSQAQDPTELRMLRGALNNLREMTTKLQSSRAPGAAEIVSQMLEVNETLKQL
eukprot:m51a1_g8234 putative nucleocytoplasmic transporter (1372) ;mRNA; r:69589-74337